MLLFAVKPTPTEKCAQKLAGVLVVDSGGLAASGGAKLRRFRALDPETLSDRITALARGGDAEVTPAGAAAGLGLPDEAAVAALNLLERRGQCYRERRG